MLDRKDVIDVQAGGAEVGVYGGGFRRLPLAISGQEAAKERSEQIKQHPASYPPEQKE